MSRIWLDATAPTTARRLWLVICRSAGAAAASRRENPKDRIEHLRYFTVPCRELPCSRRRRLRTWAAAGEVIAHWSTRASTGLVEALLLLIAIVLLRLAIRELWLADFAAAVLIAIIVGGLRPEAAVLLPAWLTFMWLLRRFGLRHRCASSWS